jgi:dipeptidase D
MFQPTESKLLSPSPKTAKATYQSFFAKKPVIQVIHAGLECAIIGDRCQGMQMISLGPTIENPHSPNERLFIPSVKRCGGFWQVY